VISGMESLGLRWRQMRFNPLRSLTPERLTSAIDQADAGWVREFALILEAIEKRDAIVRTVLGKRKAAVARQPWWPHWSFPSMVVKRDRSGSR
jgi:phage gp29-like protein